MDWDELKDLLKMFFAFMVVAVVVFSIICGLVAIPAWYSCGIQSEMYKRQGIEISQKELFWGAKPPEYNINVRESGKGK